MSIRKRWFIPVGLAALFASGCASNDNLGVETSSINKPPQKAQNANLTSDPVCVALWARIEEIHKEGTPDRIRKVSEGKTKSVVVKRSSLATMAKLSRINQDFRAKCSTFTPTKTAQARPQVAAPSGTTKAKP